MTQGIICATLKAKTLELATEELVKWTKAHPTARVDQVLIQPVRGGYEVHIYYEPRSRRPKRKVAGLDT